MKFYLSVILLTGSMGIINAQNQAPVSGGWPPKNLTQNSPKSSAIDNLFRKTKEAAKVLPTQSVPKSTDHSAVPKIDAPEPEQSTSVLETIGSTPKKPMPEIDTQPTKELPTLELPTIASPVEDSDIPTDRVDNNLLLDSPLPLPTLPQPIDQVTPLLPERNSRPRPPRKHVSSLYTLGPGDTVTFSTFERSDLSRTVRIAPDGTVSYLQAIAISAKGLTVDQLRDRMETELQKYRRDFKLIVTPDGLASKEYAVLGQVREPGTFPIERPVTVLEAIARARGVETGTIRGTTVGLADFDRSFVSRNGRKLSVDISKLYQHGDMSQNVTLQPNDYVYIASSLNREFYILGALRNPGRFKITEPLTVASAISLAGGFNNNAYRMKVLIIRGDLEKPETTVINMKDILNGKALDQKIKTGDIVFVARRPFDIFERVVDSAITTYVQTLTAEALNQNFVPFSL